MPPSRATANHPPTPTTSRGRRDSRHGSRSESESSSKRADGEQLPPCRVLMASTSSPRPRCSLPVSEFAAAAAAVRPAQPRPRTGSVTASFNMIRSRAFNARLVSLLALLFLAPLPIAAVLINVTNCLPEAYQSNTPTPLQWVPLYADAKFDTKNERHTLRFTVWGNVTGAQNKTVLPPPTDRYWANPDETNGKIIERPADNATTLSRRLTVLTYDLWHQAENFCKNDLVNGTCPLPPIFAPAQTFPFGLPSVNITHDFFSSYAFASFAATMVLVYGDTKATNIGCMSATITPDLGSVAWVLKFLPLLVLLFSGFAVVFAGIFSPWGTTDIFHWSSNYGRDADLLRLVTPGFGDCLQYIQFVALTGGLSLSYPGFYQPIVSQLSWSSLMFNQSFVTRAPSWQSVVDGIYITNATENYGMHQLGQLVGMAEASDIWAGMMVWLTIIIVATFLLTQAGFVLQRLWRHLNKISEEDLRAKNIPFSVGNLVRIAFNYMLLPIVALSTFQLVIAAGSPPYTVALAVLTLVLLLGFAVWILYVIIRTRPKSVLFDDLPTVLRYGPLYNTYSDEVAAFALIPVLLSLIRGIAIGAVQPSGVAQVVLLAICEVIQLFTLHAFRPFQSPTSMNAYHTFFSILRMLVILLMVAFVPSLGITEGTKGWIGYAILLIHALLLVLGFFLSALQTTVEVIARMLGAGIDDTTGLTRGGLSKIFGMRQLSRREIHRAMPSRGSQLSTASMLAAEEGSRTGYLLANGRARSASSASGAVGLAGHRHRSSSALDSIDMYSGLPRNDESATAYVPGTPGGSSMFSFTPSPTSARKASSSPADTTDPYYRPPRRRRDTLRGSSSSSSSSSKARIDSALGSPDGKRHVHASEQPAHAETDARDDLHRGSTPAPAYAALNPYISRPDYATREVDFYYGVRGPALRSVGASRKLGTGPADPTGPVATATGWFRNMFNGKTKDKGKGFEVVRSSRMPPALARDGDKGTPPEGIPLAMGVLRNGPIDSDDSDDSNVRSKNKKPPARGQLAGQQQQRNGDEGDQRRSASVDGPDLEMRLRSGGGGGGGGGTRALDGDGISALEEAIDLPTIRGPRSADEGGLEENSSRAPHLAIDLGSPSSTILEEQPMAPTSGADSAMSVPTAMPFQRTASTKHSSTKSSTVHSTDLAESDVASTEREEHPASFGQVPQREISRIHPRHPRANMRGRSAELVNGKSSIDAGLQFWAK